eukprot:1474473-Rhodomonas_salina.2
MRAVPELRYQPTLCAVLTQCTALPAAVPMRSTNAVYGAARCARYGATRCVGTQWAPLNGQV